MFVIDVNAIGVKKSVKNNNSIRLVPLHPFVLNDLGFKEFVREQKALRKEGLLFSDVHYENENGYQGGMSKWFGHWKKKWLAKESYKKNFHGFRHTFIQQAQNQAKMTDRCSQEITGHAVEGVSAIHLAYSGRLKPKDVLEELKKLEYGWEKEPPVKPPVPTKKPKSPKAPRKTKGKKARKK